MKKMNPMMIIVVIAVIVLLAVFPLIMLKDAEFGGADGEAMDLIGEVNPDYEPIAEPLIELPSGEVESMLFALQASLGAGFIGYFIAYAKYRPKKDTPLEAKKVVN